MFSKFQNSKRNLRPSLTIKAVKKIRTNTCASYSDNCNADGNSYELILVCLQKGVSNEIAILVQVTW